VILTYSIARMITAGGKIAKVAYFFGKCSSDAGYAVVRLVEALRYKLAGCGFNYRWCHWNFSLT